MEYLVFSILCSVTVSVLLKIARQYQVDIHQAIAFNYLMAISLTYFILKPNFSNTVHLSEQQPWLIFISLGILLPTIFLVMFRAVETAGIIRSDAAQRLSLFIPIIASFTIFAESISPSRLVSLGVAFLALFCLLYKPASHTQHKQQYAALFLIGTWLGYGTIDILFKQLSKAEIAFPIGLIISFGLAAILIFSYLFFKRITFNLRSVIAGLILGLFNFGNILFYIRAHQVFKDNPTLVFTTMNIGVISIGTIVGALVFKEKISTINALGIILAITAVCLLYFWAMKI
ncbi:DMT family transporter [Pelistega sp. NLN82]|uniref:DMT family transporter n=1 Tax=Pelistega ratti TaxID=2652177 RepID=A0A6L9Y364_9BURK|nr:DMT family transporter [Pelistega ratti]NEN74792.1 DMT family transporter [Pelistega ratti]